jgi:hypothetical protein
LKKDYLVVAGIAILVAWIVYPYIGGFIKEVAEHAALVIK